MKEPSPLKKADLQCGCLEEQEFLVPAVKEYFCDNRNMIWSVCKAEEYDLRGK